MAKYACAWLLLLALLALAGAATAQEAPDLCAPLSNAACEFSVSNNNRLCLLVNTTDQGLICSESGYNSTGLTPVNATAACKSTCGIAGVSFLALFTPSTLAQPGLIRGLCSPACSSQCSYIGAAAGQVATSAGTSLQEACQRAAQANLTAISPAPAPLGNLTAPAPAPALLPANATAPAPALLNASLPLNRSSPAPAPALANVSAPVPSAALPNVSAPVPSAATPGPAPALTIGTPVAAPTPTPLTGSPAAAPAVAQILPIITPAPSRASTTTGANSSLPTVTASGAAGLAAANILMLVVTGTIAFVGL